MDALYAWSFFPISVASVLSWKNVLARASAPSMEELLIVVMIRSMVTLPRCMSRERGDINECLVLTNLSSPVYSDRRASVMEKSSGVGCQRRYVAMYWRKVLMKNVPVGNSARVTNHHVALKNNRRKSMATK